MINAQNNLDDLYTNWEADLAQAKLDLLNAESDLDDLETDRRIMNYERCTDERIEELEDDLAQAKRFYAFKGDSSSLQALNTAQANLDFCNADFTAEEIAEAELKVQLGEASVIDLQDRVDTLAEGPDPDQVTILETQLAIAQKRADSLRVKAPFDGIVTVLPAQAATPCKPGPRRFRWMTCPTSIWMCKSPKLISQRWRTDRKLNSCSMPISTTPSPGEVTQIAPVGYHCAGCG